MKTSGHYVVLTLLTTNLQFTNAQADLGAPPVCAPYGKNKHVSLVAVCIMRNIFICSINIRKPMMTTNDNDVINYEVGLHLVILNAGW